MIKNFNKELELMNENHNINDKLMIFSLYNEMYNAIQANTSEIFKEKYLPFMEKTFELIIAEFNVNDEKSVNAKQFMELYIEMLKKIILFNIIPEAKEIVAIFEKELNSFIEANKFVNVIDSYNTISLDTKVKLMSQFREYINDIYLTAIKLYTEKNSNDLRNTILDLQTTKLDDYLKESLENDKNETDIINNLNPNMISITKEYLINKLKNGKNSLIDLKDEKEQMLFSNFNDDEQKILLMAEVYAISGYPNNNFKKNERIKEICDVVNISKLKYTKAALSIGIKIIKLMKKTENDDDYEIIFEDSPNNKR